VKACLLLIAVLLLQSCTSKQVEASGYTDVPLGAIATLRLPAQFQPLQNRAKPASPSLIPNPLGETAGPAEDQNFWAVTHAFAFRETPQGIPTLLTVSRVADKQSFAAAQLYYENVVRLTLDPRWSTAKRLDWKPNNLTKSQTLFTAELETGVNGSTVYVIVDRDNLIQALLMGVNTVLLPQVAQQVLTALPANYRLSTPLEDYFHQASQALQAHASTRRTNYLGLLETLQKEELDYTPTPRVVVFNPNLVGQFHWPGFDRSAVPSHFAIAGHLGALQSGNKEAWAKLEAFFPGTHLIASNPTGLESLTSTRPAPRSLTLLNDSGWTKAQPPQAFATLEFPFDKPIPNLSEWLTALEAIGRQASAQGLVN